MDGYASRRLRGSALHRLALLSTKLSTDYSGESTFDRLSNECLARHANPPPKSAANGFTTQHAETSHIPMSFRELEVLLALCKAAPALHRLESAQKLLRQLTPYMSESFAQRFAPSPYLRHLSPSPWEYLTASLTHALISIGIRFKELKPEIRDVFFDYLEKFLAHSESSGEEDNEINTASLVASFVGFMETAAKYPKFWSSVERLEVLKQTHQVLSDDFLLNAETAFTTIRNTQKKSSGLWKRYTRDYDNSGRPIGAMLLLHALMSFLVSSTSMVVAGMPAGPGIDATDLLLDGRIVTTISPEDFSAVETFANMAASVVQVIDNGAPYLTSDSEQRRELIFKTKAHALSAYCNCVVLSNSADPNLLYGWLLSVISDPAQMSCILLASPALKTLAILAKDGNNSEQRGKFITTLHQYIIEGAPGPHVVAIAIKSLSTILKHSSQDQTITTLNTLGHVLSSAKPERALEKSQCLQPFDTNPGASNLSLASPTDESRQTIYLNIIDTIVGIAEALKDPKMSSLAQNILMQRVNKMPGPVNGRLVTSLGRVLLMSSTTECKAILQVINKLSYDSVWHDDQLLTNAVLDARIFLAKAITPEMGLYSIYLTDMLEEIAAIGDEKEQNEEKRQADAVVVQLAARQIEQYLQPLAILLAQHGTQVNFALRYGYTAGLRDFWINCALHGLTYGSETVKRNMSWMKVIARYTPPLIAGVTEDKAFDANLEEGSLLNRGMSPSNVFEHKRRLVLLLPEGEFYAKTLPYPRTIYLEAVYSLECLRAESGGCSKVLAYFVEPAFKTGDASNLMTFIVGKVTDIYMSRVLQGIYPEFSASYIADELAEIFVGCCHRLEKVQGVAFTMADRIISIVPSALCRRKSLFALLELLTLMWVSCLQEETDEYATRSTFTSTRGRITIEMPDSFQFRKKTLKNFDARARLWVTKVLNIAPIDLKGLLQTYLSEFDDEGSSGHVALGRSFALEMGSAVPRTDQRLASIDYLKDCNANIASDFVKQYTVRQAYRTGEPGASALTPGKRNSFVLAPLHHSDLKPTLSSASISDLMAQMKGKDYSVGVVPVDEVRDMLRNAASLVCAGSPIEGALLRHLVAIPFEVFTKKSIELGILLWTGIMHERPQLQSRLLAEIARNFEMTVEKQMGLFAESFNIDDAFDVKMENAPSNKEQHITEQNIALNLLTPHLRILHLLSSNFHANRHSNPNIQRIYLHLMQVALKGLKHASGHPLAREGRFHVVHLGLQVLRYSIRLTERQKFRLKDLIISGALSWFKFAPRWSFGGNRLQVKAEAHLLSDVANLLNSISSIGKNSETMRMKQDLLLLLLENESYRLATWLYPLEHSRRHHLLPSYNQKPPTDASVAVLLPVAWQEDPAIAVHLTHRFQLPILHSTVRNYIINYPEKVLDIPDAVHIMLGNKLSPDLSFQLRYLLYWKPINPVTATTYFLPGFGSDAFVLQYAMRSLESYSIDVTFFYVPQIVQTLRYDVLGYVERFILETAKFSQLFAHQIIWNMKANAYKDEDSQIPDPVKPKLDAVMTSLVDSFSGADRSFYEREFTFFNEVTSISGKLRPYIRKTKPEKNQKIAEELAKITVDVGVYLPSNPDSVVIDIDRHSGKSLQSHAKAPFMATFKTRKKMPVITPIQNADGQPQPLDRQGHRQESTSIVTREVMQAAIFKVGDDCRQDMLALQLIAAFRNIFNSVGLDVFVYPYRVTATAPGCGVIDVLPNSISRDMLGRDHEMGLYEYFVHKYGGEDSIKFQEARGRFVKSMAAYSVISYLLKFKDRHNGNIMLDDGGHIMHIDFGFCFDIAPGGITFERAPFKLTAEMISVMGGSTDAQPYLWFEELCIKAFLVSRQYVDKLTGLVMLMLGSELPCFKPETIKNFRDRFVLDQTDREAADYMRFLVKKSYSSYSTGQYDRFQHLTNGIPY